MAYSVNWVTRVVSVPASDLVYIEPGSYQLSMVAFHKEARRLEWEFDEGLWWPQILDRGDSRTLAGVPYAPFDEIINGYTVTFDPTASKVSVVGSNNNILDVMNINGVSVATSNSAGLTDVDVTRLLSYQDEVHVDTMSAFDGTVYPTGTEARIVNNITDALAIATENNLSTLVIHTDMTITENISGYRVRASRSAGDLNLTIDAAAVCDRTQFSGLIILGDFASSMDPIFNGCMFGTTANISGLAEHCHFDIPTITIAPGRQLTADSCTSIVAGQIDRPTIDMNAGQDTMLVVANWNGGLRLLNCDTAACRASFNVTAGALRLDATCSDGDATIRGDVDVEDNSTGTAVTNASTHSAVKHNTKLQANKAVIAPDDSTSTIYDDDGVTPLVVFDHPDERTRDPQ